MDLVFLIVVVLGFCVGSFLNVLITRLSDRKRTLLSPRFSACPHCNAPIRARDNIPVLSYLLLRGRCRDCKSQISILYPLVETAGAAIAATAYLLHGFSLGGLAMAVFLYLLLAVAVTDFRTYFIPDFYTIGGAAVGLVLTLLSRGWGEAARAAGDALIVASMLWLLGVVVGRRMGREALGFGDVLLVGMMATFLGFGSTVLAIYAAAVSGILLYFVHRRLNSDRLIPFGLHLAIGGTLMALIGETDYALMVQSFLPWY